MAKGVQARFTFHPKSSFGGVPIQTVLTHTIRMLLCDALLKSLKSFDGTGIRLLVLGNQFFGHFLVWEWAPKVEPCTAELIRTAEGSKLDLQGCDTLALDVTGEASLGRRDLHSLFRRNPAVPFSHKHDQVRTTPFDLRQTDLQHQQFLGVFVVERDGFDTPPQVYRLEVLPTLSQVFCEVRKDDLPQMVPLRVHIAKRG